MTNSWSIVMGKMGDIGKTGLPYLYSSLSKLYGKDMQVFNEDALTTGFNENFIFIGNGNVISQCVEKRLFEYATESEGYTVYVGDSIFAPEKQMICITGFDDKGLLYGIMDFCNKYLGDVLWQHVDLWRGDIFSTPFERKLPDWKTTTYPKIKTRAIWTWGHVIYDYKGFFDNMAKMRLNEIVIWNDHAPLNANEIVTYAHSRGIKVIWGFSWGWSTSIAEDFKKLTDQSLVELKNSIVSTYEKEYAKIEGDGIYFQSLTELSAEILNGKCVAEVVTDLVNDTAQELLSRYPDLHIQFGLHATSVKSKLDIIKKVDPRLYIIWEDCGSFPFNYFPEKTQNFDDTVSFTNDLMKLREKSEKFGAVFKGMLKLDWTRFKHHESGLRIGEYDKEFIKKRQIEKNQLWKVIQASWIKNAKYAQLMTTEIVEKANNPIVEAVIEDSMFENDIMFPAALYSELIWDPNRDINEIMGQVAKYPCVKFANI